ncbi:hypothetical protein Tco_0820281 [Tanacetum coccineum]|uniref:Uncharacterized protein n=1 Tax=Tanacetum coccineum TaxID=301880 RepID=A0ABQ5AC14_9ASTR
MENNARNLSMRKKHHRVTSLVCDNEKRRVEFAQEDAPNTGGMDQREDLMTGDVEKSTRKRSDNTDEPANVLSTLEAANRLSSESFPTASPGWYKSSRRIVFSTFLTLLMFQPSVQKEEGRRKMIESSGTQNKKIHEQLDAQWLKELVQWSLPWKNS